MPPHSPLFQKIELLQKPEISRIKDLVQLTFIDRVQYILENFGPEEQFLQNLFAYINTNEEHIIDSKEVLSVVDEQKNSINQIINQFIKDAAESMGVLDLVFIEKIVSIIMIKVTNQILADVISLGEFSQIKIKNNNYRVDVTIKGKSHSSKAKFGTERKNIPQAEALKKTLHKRRELNSEQVETREERNIKKKLIKLGYLIPCEHIEGEYQVAYISIYTTSQYSTDTYIFRPSKVGNKDRIERRRSMDHHGALDAFQKIMDEYALYFNKKLAAENRLTKKDIEYLYQYYHPNLYREKRKNSHT